MTSKTRAVVFAIILATSIGCSDAATPVNQTVDQRDVEAAFQTDSLAYSVRPSSIGYEGAITVTFTNPTSEAVYLTNCAGSTGLQLDKYVDGRFVSVWSPVILACLSPPIVIQPGGQYAAIVPLFFGSGNNFPQLHAVEVSGTYRLVWAQVLRTYRDGVGESLPLSQRLSNRFMLTIH